MRGTFPARQVAFGGKELLSPEDTMHGDPTSITVYGIALISLLKRLETRYPEGDPKMVAFADDLTRPGRL